MKKYLFAALLSISASSYSAEPMPITGLVDIWNPKSSIGLYQVYCNASGLVAGVFIAGDVKFQTPSGTTAVISYYDGVIGSTGVRRFDATLTYTDATRATLSISGCPIIQ